MSQAQGTGRYPTGLTALVVPIPEAEPVVGRWRTALDPSAAYGVPAHVTVMYPFLPLDAVDREALAGLFAGYAPFEVVFARCGRLPELLYLEPVPGEPFVQLTHAVTGRWPEARPYGGKYETVMPHLSIGYENDGAALDEAGTAIERGLPVTARVGAVQLVAYDGTVWQVVEDFPLTAAGSPR
ncbi:2'-5' RNA ligase family protein [Nonomuraea sp. NPDC049141]|uniref:2'-5' RNA ligase family protein n=1 Tax=unclassified Nonomuraea TaxID=2593643 RepID=UPI0033FEF304